MAGSGGVEKFMNDADVQAMEKFNRQLVKRQQRAELMLRNAQWRNSKLPPFSIEPMKHVRSRTIKPMTDAERALRKQWVQDQKLAPGEPRFVPAMDRVNIFRRLFRIPMDFLFYKAVVPVAGKAVASYTRFFMPKALAAILAVYYSAYHLKYASTDWTRIGGWHMFRNKPQIFPGDPIPEGYYKQPSDFADKGFKSRTALRD